MYQKMAKEAIEEVFSRGKLPIISGGTGLYLNTLIYDMDFSGADRDDRLRLELEKKPGPMALKPFTAGWKSLTRMQRKGYIQTM